MQTSKEASKVYVSGNNPLEISISPPTHTHQHLLSFAFLMMATVAQGIQVAFICTGLIAKLWNIEYFVYFRYQVSLLLSDIYLAKVFFPILWVSLFTQLLLFFYFYVSLIWFAGHAHATVVLVQIIDTCQSSFVDGDVS